MTSTLSSCNQSDSSCNSSLLRVCWLISAHNNHNPQSQHTASLVSLPGCSQSVYVHSVISLNVLIHIDVYCMDCTYLDCIEQRLGENINIMNMLSSKIISNWWSEALGNLASHVGPGPRSNIPIPLSHQVTWRLKQVLSGCTPPMNACCLCYRRLRVKAMTAGKCR